MANGHGGARVGAGQKKKALTDKLLEGNPGRRKLTVVEFNDTADLRGLDMPPPREFLSAQQKNGKELLAAEIYEATWRWLDTRNCAKLVPAQVIEQYAVAISRWIQCEEAITEFGFLAKHPTTGNAIPSPYVAMSQQPVVSDISDGARELCHRVQRHHAPRRYDGAAPVRATRKLKHNFKRRNPR
jgi:hypothetical protein